MKYLFLFLIATSGNVYAYDYLVEALRGTVTLQASSRPLEVNEELHSGDVVATADKSFIRILDASGGKISLGPKSSIKLLTKNTGGAKSTIELLKGQVRAAFEKKDSDDYKLFLKTKTASMGVRGTDFHLVYNPENNVSTVLTYEGQVEFSDHPVERNPSIEDFSHQEKITIPKGHISGVFYNGSKATSPIKISPLQFSILEGNQDLKEGSAKKITRPKESKSLGKNLEAGVARDLSQNDAEIIPVPQKFLDDEYFEDRAKGNPTIKNGGYLDLKTGIYIHPSEDSEYDAVNDVYYPPVEFGGIDEESGEYVAPPGLILHPLKGFMYTTDLVQKGLHNMTTTVNKLIITPVADTVSEVGGKAMDTLKDTALMVKEHTGAVGKAAGKGVELVGSGVSGGIKLAQNSSSLALNTVADSLNYAIHDTFLSRIKEFKERVPIVNYFKIKFHQIFDYNYTHTDKYNMYDKNIERGGAVLSQTDFDLKVQRSFYTNFFIRPRLEFSNSQFVGDHDNLTPFEYLNFYLGSDFGYSTTIKKMKYQTYFTIEKGKKRNAQPFHDNYITTEDAWRFGFNKILLGQKMFSTTFAYQYERYHGPFDGNGERHQFKVSEILSMNDARFARLSLDWNKIPQQKYGTTSNYSLRLNYFIAALTWNMNLEYWLGIRFIENAGTIVKRNKEKNYFAGLGLTKNFESNFSVFFNYELLKQTSPNHTFAYLSQSLMSGLSYLF